MKKFINFVINFIDKIIPKRSWVPMASIVIFNFIVYYGSSLIVRNIDQSGLNNFSIFIDDAIPFEPFFISFYILAYAQWFIGYIILARGEEAHFYKAATSEMIAKALCLACFLIIPCKMIRPTLVVDDFWSFATNVIYSSDKPYNLFPSIHCLESWVVFRCCLRMNISKNVDRSTHIFQKYSQKR